MSAVQSKFVIGFIGLVVVTVIASVSVQTFVSGSETGCVVEDKDRTQNSEGQSDMRIYTENCGVLTVSDNWLKGQFNSADTYSRIDVGSTYDFETVGIRVGLFSLFPNIIKVEEVQ